MGNYIDGEHIIFFLTGNTSHLFCRNGVHIIFLLLHKLYTLILQIPFSRNLPLYNFNQGLYKRSGFENGCKFVLVG